VPTATPTPHTVEALLRVVEERDCEVVFLKLMVDKLTLQLLRARRAQYGRSSEQLDDVQIALIEGAPLYELPAPKAVPKPEAANGAGIDRQLPAHLPRENQVHRPATNEAAHDANGNACGCTACGGRLRQIGVDVSKQLECMPARFKVIRHVRPKLACVSCEAIFQAAAPSRPIARGVAGPALLANVLVSKYCDHIPLHRLARIHARDGVCFDPSTYGGWVEHSHALLDPLVAALGRYALAGAKVHADDTPVPVLDPGRGRTKTGWLWVYVRDDRPAGSTEAAAWYRYSPNRKGCHPQDHLKDYRGILQADAYGGYGKIYVSGRVEEAACWAHARRPFWDMYENQGCVEGSVADQALQRIAALYAIEAQIWGQPPDVRRRERQARAGPLLEGLRAWLTSMVGRVSAKSELAKAIGCSLTRW
jgi:transposase